MRALNLAPWPCALRCSPDIEHSAEIKAKPASVAWTDPYAAQFS